MTPEELLAEARELAWLVRGSNNGDAKRVAKFIDEIAVILEREAAAAKEWRCPLEYCEIRGPHGHSGLQREWEAANAKEAVPRIEVHNDLTPRQRTLAVMAASIWIGYKPKNLTDVTWEYAVDCAQDILKEVERRG